MFNAVCLLKTSRRIIFLFHCSAFAMVPCIRKPAPRFCLNGAQGTDTLSNVSLEDYKGKWVVLLFYPMDWTFVCPTEIVAFNDARDRLKQLNTEVLCISGDSPYTHLAWLQAPKTEGGLGGLIELPLLSDVTREVMKAYGVYNDDCSELDGGQAFRGLFLIDPKGCVRHMYVNDNGVGRNVEETIRVLKALQFSDDRGVVCPANWKEGGKSFAPTPTNIAKFLMDLSD